jgi:L-rhamnonate dehydratase
MKIDRVEALHLRIPKVERKADGSQEVLIVRITTDTGLVGHGEAVSNAHTARAAIEAPRSAPFRDGLAVALTGLDPIDTASRWQDMYASTKWFSRGGAAMHAIAACDTALWDIAGQVANKPSGGLSSRGRDRVRAYASVLFPDTEKEAAETATLYASQGFTAVKFGWGKFGLDRAHDNRIMQAIRGAVGDKVEIMVDVGRRWQADEAITRSKELFERFNAAWVEEALEPENVAGYARLARSVPGRIATGEFDDLWPQYMALLDAGVGVIQPDIGRAGGLTLCRKLTLEAARRGVWCIPHCFGSGVQLAASLQWARGADDASMPIIEFPFTQSPLRHGLVNGLPEKLIDGQVPIPDRPGLGITLDDQIVTRYRVT